MPVFKTKIKIHNRFDVYKKDIRTGEEKQIAQAENIILDQLWTNLTTSSAWATHIWFGSGTGAIDASRTTLFTSIAAITATEEAIDLSSYFEGVFSRRRRITLSEVQYNGQFIREVGAGVTARPYTHALLLDMNGNPVTIEKTDTEILTIYSTIFGYIDHGASDLNKMKIPTWGYHSSYNGYSDFISGLVGGALPTNSNLYYVFSNGRNFGYSVWSGSMVAVTTIVLSTFSPTTKKITFPVRRLPVGSNAVNPIRWVGLSGANPPNVLFAGFDLLGNAGFAGSFIEGESIGVGDGETKDFATTYGFIKPGAKVYSDGIEQVSGVTVDELSPNVNRLDYFFNVIESTNSNLIFGLNGNAPRDNNYTIFENPFYESIGFYSATVYQAELYCSNDLENWTQLCPAGNYSPLNIPEAYRYYRYFKLIKPSTASSTTTSLINVHSDDLVAVKNVHFDTAPALGEVITIDYTTQECVKTSDYVIDVGMEFELGEYVEEY